MFRGATTLGLMIFGVHTGPPRYPDDLPPRPTESRKHSQDPKPLETWQVCPDPDPLPPGAVKGSAVLPRLGPCFLEVLPRDS